ncbi:MAG: heavy-metal-associated domain-containing protein [Candidatus Izemoplasmatales bacterium]|jgi:copper ion binding protein|nr:heavy-metal-associated domain-containing protein [Candidatus Izemoplasmatales bacterium]
MRNDILNVTGMSCMHCAGSVTRTVKMLDGVKTVEVKLSEKKVLVEYDEVLTSKADIAKAIEKLGYRVE